MAVIFFVTSGVCAIATACTALGRWPLSSGRFIIGDLVTLGPGAFVIAAIVHAVIGCGLLWLKNWARRLAIVVAAVGLYFLIAPVSSAGADVRFGGIAITGSQIIVRVLVLWYLTQDSVAQAFRC